MIARLIVLVVALLLVVGCTPAKTPDPSARATARVALVSMAELVRGGFNTCADYVEETGDAATGEKCLNVLRPAKAGILTAAEALKAWQHGENGSALQVIGCTAKAVLIAVEGVNKLLAPFLKDGMPDWVADAVSWAKWAAAMALPTCDPAKPGAPTPAAEIAPPEHMEEW